MPWATVAKAIIEVTSNTAANVFDIMAFSDFLNGAPYPMRNEIAASTTADLLQSNQNLQITNESDSDAQVSF
jgi:hypothetical protein